MTKKRSVLIAGLLNLICLGLGFLYVGNVTYAIGFPLGLLLLTGVASWTKVIFTPSGFGLVISIYLILWILGVILAGIMAYRKGKTELSKTQRWYVYIAFAVLSVFVGNWYIDNRGELFGYNVFRLPSKSMVNTLLLGDFIISDTWKYRNNSPKRGDVVVFLSTKDLKTLYVKRVIGLPNDFVHLKKGSVYVNGKKLDEPYVKATNNHGIKHLNEADEYTVPGNSYFVLGDNRDNSFDSRHLGYIPRNYIYGSVEFIWFSFDSSEGIRSERVGRVVN